jgi:hypothetical protein
MGSWTGEHACKVSHDTGSAAVSRWALEFAKEEESLNQFRNHWTVLLLAEDSVSLDAVVTVPGVSPAVSAGAAVSAGDRDFVCGELSTAAAAALAAAMVASSCTAVLTTVPTRCNAATSTSRGVAVVVPGEYQRNGVKGMQVDV